MKTLEIKHGMALENTRAIVTRDGVSREYVTKGYETLTRLERLLTNHKYDVCLSSTVITITVFPNKM